MFTGHIKSLVLGCALLISTTSISQSYVYPGSANCPNVSKEQHSWKTYFMGGYGDSQPPFTIRFDHLKHAIGTIPAGGRFTMFRRGNQWTASGKNVDGDSKMVAYSNGDPAKYELSVWGAQLGYNEKGQIFLDKELIGTLLCGIGPDATQ
ncbi:hypothetical protein [Bradyrhizobium sp. DASA03120]|uniref:hypothetical protein n=1 Tax=Bradyrhizobium sp. SMVTL-02 TaxID=3395917 RepID=UPI003F6FE03A